MVTPRASAAQRTERRRDRGLRTRAATLYHFGDKQELYAAVLDEILTRAIALAAHERHHRATHRSVADRLGGLRAAGLDRRAPDPARGRKCAARRGVAADARERRAWFAPTRRTHEEVAKIPVERSNDPEGLGILAPSPRGFGGRLLQVMWLASARRSNGVLDRLRELARSRGPDGRRIGGSESIRDAVAGLVVDARAMWFLGSRGFATFARGEASPEHSVLELFGSEIAQRVLGLPRGCARKESPCR